MNRKVIIGIIIVVVIIVGVAAWMMYYRTPSSNNTGSSSQSPGLSASGSKFTINANDNSADLTTLNVKKGDTISITFNVKQDGTYHGGLEFKSDTVSSSPIEPGKSATVTFTADKSFDFTPYWYQSQVKKDYIISVKVS